MSLIQRLKEGTLIAAAGLVLTTGCTPLDQNGNVIGSGTGDSTYGQTGNELRQTDHAANADDANLTSGFLEILAGAAGLRSPGAGLLIGAGAGVAGRESIIEGQKAAAQTGQGYSSNIPAGYTVREGRLVPEHATTVFIPPFGNVFIDPAKLTAYGRGFVGGPKTSFREFGYFIASCNYWKDGTADGERDGVLDFPQECIGLGDTFSTNATITLLCGIEKDEKIHSKLPSKFSCKVYDGQGKLIREESAVQVPGGPAPASLMVPYTAGEIPEGNYMVEWYIEDKFYNKLEFKVGK